MTARPLRLALIRQRYAADGGAERFVARALEALRAQNVSLSLVTRRWQSTAGVDVLACDPFYLGSVWRDWSFARCACAKIETAALDLVQSHERIACCDVYRAGDGVHREWLRQRARTFGAWRRATAALNPYHHYVKAAEGALFRSPRLRAVICNSKMVKHEIQHYFGLPDSKLRVIYSGVDLDAFHPDTARHRSAVRARHAIPDSATLLLFVGSGFSRKGVRALIEAMARLPPSVYLLIVGADKRAERYKAQAARLGLEARVRFAGRQGEIAPYYGAADIFVLPTLYDPFPNAALEALASGLPVVTSTKCGAAELIVDGRNGEVCDALDVSTLAQKIAGLLPAERRAPMRLAARNSVAHLSLDAMGAQLVAFYRELLSLN